MPAVQLRLPIMQPTGERYLVLSIASQHVERILSGAKRFELRKVLPRGEFDRVFLYEAGGRGIVASFRPAQVLRLPIEELWRRVGEAATTRERFERYFGRRDSGCAIEIADPIVISPPLDSAILRSHAAEFTAPQSFLVVGDGHPLYEMLAGVDGARAHQPESMQLRLARIEPQERSSFVALATKYVSASYADITEDFARSLLESSDAGEDVRGFLTLRKEVLSIRDRSNDLLGFTTLTYKVGGSVKTGPTILLDQHRHQRLGRSVRVAIEDRARGLGQRKVYCTCPDSSNDVMRYLLASGYMIEAHLDSHYAEDHGELVFGKLLVPVGHRWVMAPRTTSAPGHVVASENLARSRGIAAVLRLLRRWGLGLNVKGATRVYDALGRFDVDYEAKPRGAVFLVSGKAIRAVAFVVPKRGGSTKCLIASETTHGPSLENLIASVEDRARKLEKRKAYYIHPLADTLVVGLLQARGYGIEGALRSPYLFGQDCVVLSKRFDRVP
jgi:predicted transcriptional regulator